MQSKRVFPVPWADLADDDDDSLGDVPSFGASAVKANITAPDPLLTAGHHRRQGGPALLRLSMSLACCPKSSSRLFPQCPTPFHTSAAPSPPPPLPLLPAPAKAASLPPSSERVVFQSKPNPSFKSWSDLAKSSVSLSHGEGGARGASADLLR